MDAAIKIKTRSFWNRLNIEIGKGNNDVNK